MNRGACSKFSIGRAGRVWFFDTGTGASIYTAEPGRWKNFGEGKMLEDLVRALGQFITKGTKLKQCHLGPHPTVSPDGDPFGYGPDMEKVRQKARQLGIINY